MDWKPKSEPLPDEMKRAGETFLVGNENDPHWFAFVSPADDGDMLMVDKDGHETMLFAHYSNEMDRGDMGWTHWVRLAGPVKQAAGDDEGKDPEPCWGLNEELFEAGFEDICEDAFDDAHPEKPETLTIYEGDSIRCTAGEFVTDADSLIEGIGERAYDEMGDCAENWLASVPSEDVKELDQAVRNLFSDWAKKHGHEPRFWRVENVREITVKRTGARSFEIAK